MKSVFLSIVILLLLLFSTTTCLSSDYIPIPNDNNNTSVVVVVGCIASEREALLKFKHNLIDPSNFLGTWSTSAQDCCMWDGVVCDDFTGHVSTLNLSIFNNPMDYIYEYHYGWDKLSGKVSHSLLNLTHLKHLDLSRNHFGGRIPTFFGSMNSLRSLILSNAGFEGMVPHQLGNLSNLEYLHISSDDSYYVDSLHWLSRLHSLKFLSMKNVDLENAQDWLQVTSTLPLLEELHLIYCSFPNVELLRIANFSSLTVLHLSYNFDINLSWVFDLTSLISLDLTSANLEGTIPEGLQNLTSLKYLDLSDNNFNSSIPNWFYNFCNLETLNLRYYPFDNISSSLIYNMSSLTSLDLSKNILDEAFTVSLGKLCNLKSIALSACSLRFDISKVLKSFSSCVSMMLESLDLSDNQLSGELSDEIGQFQNLITLELSRNSLSGPFPSAIMKLSSLEYLYLSYNKFNGSFPILFPKIPNLQKVRISNNLLKGEVTENHFENATKLKTLVISRNFLTLKMTSSWIPPFQLSILGLQSCNLGSEFPLWISSQKYLRHLDMSSANLSSSVPTWFWNMISQFDIVDISHNHLSGRIPSFDSNYSSEIDLSSNNFHGVLPHFLFGKYMLALDVSNNSLSGSMYHFLCVQSNRQNYFLYLLLDGNNLSGELPDCWERWPRLSTLDLKNNNFVGSIPASMGKLIELRHLNLAHNKLSGGLPSSMSNCSNLEIIDVGYNQLVGSIPPWIGERLEGLRILSLRSNKFQNHIPNELCALVSLQVLDLANNSLSGAIPQCISNFTIMATKSSTSDFSIDGYYGFVKGTELMTKGVLKEYNSILQYVKAIDISLNKLSGELPMELTTLQGLQYLNLSNNLYTGLIPRNIGMMDSLESLDLSSNKLSGEIPSSMSKLHFLSALNLSNNKLKGGIPLSTQMQSMPESSFVGNELCGLPLTKNCSSGTHDSTSVGENHQGKKKAELNLIYVGIVAGFILGFWGSIGSLLFSLPWRVMFFQFVDRIWLHVLFFIAKCRRFTLFQV